MTDTFRTFRLPDDCILLVDPTPPTVEINGDTVLLSWSEWDEARAIPIEDYLKNRKEIEI